MQRTTIMLPPKLKREASRLARDQGLSLAELIRESLEQRIAANQQPQRDPLFSGHFTFTDDGPPDVAEHLDRYLQEVDEQERRREQQP